MPVCVILFLVLTRQKELCADVVDWFSSQLEHKKQKQLCAVVVDWFSSWLEHNFGTMVLVSW